MGGTGSFLDLFDRGTFQRLDHFGKGLLSSLPRRFIGDLANLVSKVAFRQLVKARALDLGKLTDLGTGKYIGRDHLFHAFLGLATVPRPGGTVCDLHGSLRTAIAGV